MGRGLEGGRVEWEGRGRRGQSIRIPVMLALLLIPDLWRFWCIPVALSGSFLLCRKRSRSLYVRSCSCRTSRSGPRHPLTPLYLPRLPSSFFPNSAQPQNSSLRWPTVVRKSPTPGLSPHTSTPPLPPPGAHAQATTALSSLHRLLYRQSREREVWVGAGTTEAVGAAAWGGREGDPMYCSSLEARCEGFAP